MPWDNGGGLRYVRIIAQLMWGGVLCCRHAAEKAMRLGALLLGAR